MCEMWSGPLGSLLPFPEFFAERDVNEVQNALQQKDAKTLVRILTNRSNAQRQILGQSFQNLTQKDLSSELKKLLSGDLCSLMLGLMMKPEQFEAHRLRQAMEGLGTDEEMLLEVLCMRTPVQLAKIRDAYSEEFSRDLEKDLVSETSGDFTRLLVALLKKEHRAGDVEQDVRVLAEELEHKKSDAEPWIWILTSRSPAHLANVLMLLEVVTSQSVSDAVEKRFSGDFRLGLQTLVRCIEDPNLYLAKRIHSMKWSVLQGVILSHCEEDLLAVRVAYKRLTGVSLYTTLQKQFKGDVQPAILALCRAED